MLQNVPDWLIWGSILLFVFPVLIILIGEFADDMSQGDATNVYATPLTMLRNSVLPLAFITILLRFVAGVPSSHLVVKIADTVLGIVGLNVALAFMNILLFSERSVASSRLRIPKLLLDIMRFFFVVCGAAIIISNIWGINLGSLITALGVGSVVIGLALQDTLGSLFSGIALASARHFRVGDWIKFGTEEGPVLSQNWRSVTVKTRNGDALVVPNGVIARQPLTVLAAAGGSTVLGVDLRFPYQYSPDMISALIVEAAMKTKDFHLDPAPAARVAAFDDYAIRYGIGVRVTDPQKLYAVRGEFLANLWYLAKRNGIAMPGQYNTRFELPESAMPATAVVPADLAATIARVKAFTSTPKSLEGLVARARSETYRAGQTVAEAGRPVPVVHVVTKGRARALFVTPSGDEVQLHEFESGHVVVSKAALRNGGSPYTLRAVTELETIAIPVGDFKEFCACDLALAQEIEQILSAREEAAERTLVKVLPDRAGALAGGDRIQILRDLFRT